MDYRSRLPTDDVEDMRTILDSRQARIWTTLPGIVTKVNLVAMTVEVQPAVQGKQAYPNGDVKLVNLPVIPDAPIVFPTGGGYTLTFPIAVGDECELHFQCRCIDDWWQSGHVGAPIDARMHDLSDATAHFGPKSQPKVISNISATNTQLRSNDGFEYVEIDKTGQAVRVVAAVEVDVTAPKVVVVATQEADVTAPKVTVVASQEMDITAPFVRINGDLRVTGEIIRGFGTPIPVDLGEHRHSNVQGGLGTSGPPIPGT